MARDTSELGEATAKSAGLTYVNDHEPGIRREVGRHGTDYFDPHGKPVRGEAALDRLRRLAIPPAWTDVWISPEIGRAHV